MNQSAVNFLPEDYVEKRTANRWTFISIGLCIAVMGVVTATFVMEWRTKITAQDNFDRVSHEYEEEGKKIAEMQMLDQENQRLANKAEVTAVLQERVPRSMLLAELTHLMPKGVSLLSLELKTRESTEVRKPSQLAAARQQMEGQVNPPPKPPEKEVTLELVGMAPTDGHVAAFISLLGKSPLLDDVNLIYSEEFKDNDEMLRRFRVEMKINRNADVRNSAADTSPVQKG